MRSFSLLIISLGALAACRDDNKGKGVDAAVDAAPTVTIQQVQDDTFAPATPVSLAGVVVTAIDTYGAKTGDIWVEEPEGGPFSGIHIFKGDPSVVSTLAVGDIVSITNSVKASFALSTDMTGRTEIELEPPTSMDMVHITKTGTGTVPAPAMVDALAIGKMSDLNNNGDRSAQWRMWDGVLITVTNVTETSSIAQIGGTTPDPTLKKFSITGGALLESSLSAFPTTGLGFNSCLGSATGVLSYFFDYQILQRNSADIVTGGSSCPAPENTQALCSNTSDDDGNGFSDCADNNCIASSTYMGCRAQTTIGAIDAAADANPTMPTLPAGMPTGVQLGGGTGSTADVVVMAVSDGGNNFWVSTTKNAAADTGIYVFAGGGSYVTSADIGSTLTLFGTLNAFNNDTQGEVLPEFQVLGVANKTAGTAPSPVTNQHVTTLTVAGTGRPYVGTLIKLSNVKIVNAADPNNHNIATLSETVSTTPTQFEATADAHILAGAAGTCYASMTGIWTYDVYNNKYAFAPTGEGTGSGTCL